MEVLSELFQNQVENQDKQLIMKRILLLFLCFWGFIAVAPAQTDCEKMLEAANSYYKEGKYDKAANMYKFIQEDCHDNNYGGAASKLRDCNQKLKEDADYRKCTSIETCDLYLDNYPQGRYVAKVQQKREKFVKDMQNARLWAEEEAAFKKCVTRKDFEAFIEQYPDGRYLEQAMEKLEEFEEERLRRVEDSIYAKCDTESACEAYLKAFPWGRYSASVWSKKNEFERKRKLEEEASKIGYMYIGKVDIANVGFGGTVIDDYGSTFYASDIKYLLPRITYNGILDEARRVQIDYKIIKPDGSLLSFWNSPSGYTSSDVFWVQPGTNNIRELTKCGSGGDEKYVSGVYKIELWYNGSRIYKISFIVMDKETPLTFGEWRKVLKKCNEHVTQKYRNGAYKGELDEDTRRAGLGMMVVVDGTYYFGNWVSGEKNGVGLYIPPAGYSAVVNCPDCVYYVGEFSSNKKAGTGKCYNRFGNLVYHGSFVDGSPSDTYPKTENGGSKFEYIEYPSGDCYVGETRDGKCCGKGIFIYNNGDLWYGDWEDDARNGSGVFMPYQGDVSSGTWKNDKQKK